MGNLKEMLAFRPLSSPQEVPKATPGDCGGVAKGLFGGPVRFSHPSAIQKKGLLGATHMGNPEEMQGMFGYLWKSFPCTNPKKNAGKKKQRTTCKHMFDLFFLGFLCVDPRLSWPMISCVAIRSLPSGQQGLSCPE